VADVPTLSLRKVMALAARRDLIAQQYVNGFREVLEFGVPELLGALQEHGGLEAAIVGTHLRFMAAYPDSLIARKCGQAEAEAAARRAGEVLESGWPRTAEGLQAFADLDAWLTELGNRRNPGTSADLVTACLFAALREGDIAMSANRPNVIPRGCAG
jgi:triphosphoribosyl-dephospho-CoA synthase